MRNIDEIIKGNKIVVFGDVLRVVPDKDHPDEIDWIREHKAEIMQYIAEKERIAREAAEIRQKKIDAIPGLNELRDAHNDLEDWNREFEMSFENGCGGLGVRKMPEYDFDALNSRYPVAAAFLKAEAYKLCLNDAKSAAGKKAIERIINGEDVAVVIADMEREWDAHVMAHVWD